MFSICGVEESSMELLNGILFGITEISELGCNCTMVCSWLSIAIEMFALPSGK